MISGNSFGSVKKIFDNIESFYGNDQEINVFLEENSNENGKFDISFYFLFALSKSKLTQVFRVGKCLHFHRFFRLFQKLSSFYKKSFRFFFFNFFPLNIIYFLSINFKFYFGLFIDPDF